MKPVYIYLDQDAELAELIEVLRQQKVRDFIIVSPAKARLFAHPINIEILARECKSIDKILTFDTPDESAKKVLKENGFDLLMVEKEDDSEGEVKRKIVTDIHHPVHPEAPAPAAKEVLVDVPKRKSDKSASVKTQTVQVSKDRASDRQKTSEDFLKKFYEEKPEIPEVSETKASSPAKIRLSRPFVILAGALILVLAGAFLFITFYLGRAKLVLTAVKTDHAFEYKLTLDKTATLPNEEKFVFPGVEVIIEKDLPSKSYSTTGNENISVKAKGTIKIYNNYSSASQTLRATTRFQDEKTGKIFRLPKQVVVPGNGSITIEVEADQPGEEYNIAAGKLNLPAFQGTPRFAKIYATATDAFKGGFKGWSKVVSAEDLSKAKESILADVQKALEAELKLKYGDLLFLDSLVVKTANIDSYAPKVGEAGEQIVLSASGKITAVGFDDKKIRNFINSLEKKTLEENQEIRESSIQNFEVKTANLSKGQISLNISGNSLFARKIDVSQVQGAVATRPLGDLAVILKGFTSIANADVSLWPFWLKKVPQDKAKINVVIQ